KEARFTPGKTPPAFATTERPAGTAKQVTPAAAGYWPDRNGAIAARETNCSEVTMADELLPQSGPALITRGARKTRTGEVVSSGMNKTIVVPTVPRVPHPK